MPKALEASILARKKSGERFVIALSGAPTTGHAAAPHVRNLQQTASDIKVFVINELLVRGNLPAATREVRQLIGT